MLNFIKKIVFLIFFPFLLFSQNNTVVDKVIAVVGNDIILYSDLENQYLQILNQGYEIIPSFKCQILEDLLYEITINPSHLKNEFILLNLNLFIELYFYKNINAQKKLINYCILN